MTVKTQKSELLEIFQAQWEEIYTEELNGLIKANSISPEDKTEGIKFLNYVDSNMKKEVLDEFESISKAFQAWDFMNIMLIGVDNLFGKSYSENGRSVIHHFDDCSYMEFDPLSYKDSMFCDYVVDRNGWSISLRLNEINSEELVSSGLE